MSDLLKKQIATAINNYRNQHQITQGELAKHLGVSRQAVQQYENQTSIPNINNIDRILNLLGYKIQITPARVTPQTKKRGKHENMANRINQPNKRSA